MYLRKKKLRIMIGSRSKQGMEERKDKRSKSNPEGGMKGRGKKEGGKMK